MAFDEATRRRALDLVREGNSPRDVSGMLGGRPSHAIIYRWMRDEGVEYVPANERKANCRLTARQKAEAVRRVEAGEGVEAVARAVGCAPSSLANWRAKLREGGEAALRTPADDGTFERGVLFSHGIYVSGADLDALAAEAAAAALASRGQDRARAASVVRELGLAAEARALVSAALDGVAAELEACARAGLA